MELCTQKSIVLSTVNSTTVGLLSYTVKMASKASSMGFLGAGQMATALARGFIRAGFVRQQDIMASATSQNSTSLKNIKTYGVKTTTNNAEVVEKSQVVWLTVKPHAVGRVLNEIAPAIRTDHHIVISAAAGIPVKTLEKYLPENTKVVRTMPNTPVIVLNGVTIYTLGQHIHEEGERFISNMLESVGVGLEMQEHHMDIMTGLTGGGPSFMYMVLDALSDGGVYAGVPKELALKLTAHTMMGSAKMVLENGKHPQELKDSVCSPAGTAIQGIRLMEREGFRGIMMDAVHAASKRALELSRLQNGEEKDVYVKR